MRANAGSQVWWGRKKEILVSVLLDLLDGTFSFTAELSNPSVPSCILQIWMWAQNWLAWSHFQGTTLTFWLHASHQRYLSETWTSELKRPLGVVFSFPKLILLLFLLFVSFQSLWGVTALTAHTHSQCGCAQQCKITNYAPLEMMFSRHHRPDSWDNGNSKGHWIKPLNLFHISHWKITYRIWTDHLRRKSSISHCRELPGTLLHSLTLAGDIKKTILCQRTEWVHFHRAKTNIWFLCTITLSK